MTKKQGLFSTKLVISFLDAKGFCCYVVFTKRLHIRCKFLYISTILLLLKRQLRNNP